MCRISFGLQRSQAGIPHNPNPILALIGVFVAGFIPSMRTTLPCRTTRRSGSLGWYSRSAMCSVRSSLRLADRDALLFILF